MIRRPGTSPIIRPSWPPPTSVTRAGCAPTHAHKVPGYAAVTVSLKATGVPPGDITADQMDAVAALADEHGFGELRVSHEQNLILADAPRAPARTLAAAGSAEPGHPNVGLLTNIIACPGGDFCALANAVSIPVAEAIQRQFDDLDICSRSASWT